MQLVFFLLILAGKKWIEATSIFSNLSNREKFLYKMLNFRKRIQFFFGAKSQSSSRHTWELGKLYTIIEFIFCFSRMQNTRVTWTYYRTYMCTRKKLAASEHWTRMITIMSLIRYR